MVVHYTPLLPQQVSTWWVFHHPAMMSRRVSKSSLIMAFVVAIVVFLLFTSKKSPDYSSVSNSFIKTSSSSSGNPNNFKEVEHSKLMQYLAIPDILNEPLKDEKRLIDVETDDPVFNITSEDCPFEDWNNINTYTIPNSEFLESWKSENKSFKENYLYHKSPSILAAFAYKDHIAVTLSSENYFSKKVYCRYYDCHRKEIPKQFVAQVFPDSTVYCGRRRGAKYISITETLEERPEISVPIQKRIKPAHFFTVCLATLYGPEPKFLQIVDFVEYYKLQGATFIHVYIRNVTDYDRTLLDDYARTNDIEIIKMHDHYWRDDFMWHHIQINDCHHRNKYFSKWTAFVDIDERIEMKDKEVDTVAKYLDTITDPNLNTLQFSIQWVLKDESSPAKFINENQIVDEMLFRKFHNTSQVGAPKEQAKCIIRPDRIGIMNIHSPDAAFRGELVTQVHRKDGVVRHYRNTSKGALLQLNLDVMYQNGPFTETDINPFLATKLTKAIVDRVRWVYDTQEVSCAEKQRTYANHGMNATCWVEMIKEDPSLAAVTFRPEKFTH